MQEFQIITITTHTDTCVYVYELEKETVPTVKEALTPTEIGVDTQHDAVECGGVNAAKLNLAANERGEQ